jgi:hypothetical protein
MAFTYVDAEMQLFAERERAACLELNDMIGKTPWADQGDLRVMEKRRLESSIESMIDLAMNLATAIEGELTRRERGEVHSIIFNRCMQLVQEIQLENMKAFKAANRVALRKHEAEEECKRIAAAKADIASMAEDKLEKQRRRRRGGIAKATVKANAALAAVPVAAPAAPPPPMTTVLADAAIEAQIADANQTARDQKKAHKENMPARILAPTDVAQEVVDPVVLPQPSNKTLKRRERDAARRRAVDLREEKQRKPIDEENDRIRKAVDLAHGDEPRRRDGQVVDDPSHCINKASRATRLADAKNMKVQIKTTATEKASAEAAEVYNSIFV